MQPEIFKVRHKIIERYFVDRYQTDHATHILQHANETATRPRRLRQPVRLFEQRH